MMNKFGKVVALPVTIFRVLKYISIQKKFLQQNTDAILEDAFRKSDGSLDRDDLKKINRYYGLAVPAILGEAFCALRGQAMSLTERWASTSQGAMTGLFDDFFDKDYLSDEAVEKMIHFENESFIKRSNQQLFDFFYKKALQEAPDKKRMQQTLLDVYKAQVESKKQKDNSITKEALTTLTYHKGGSSVVFYRSAFSPAASDAEIKLLYNLGGMMQLSNDIFDIFKDREAGIKTLITETKNINDIRVYFKNRLQEYYQTAFETGYHKKNVHEFLNIISIGIFNRCFVCLNQLEQNQLSTGNEFDVHKYSRKQLICDMDKKANMLYAAWSFIHDIP